MRVGARGQLGSSRAATLTLDSHPAPTSPTVSDRMLDIEDEQHGAPAALPRCSDPRFALQREILDPGVGSHESELGALSISDAG